MPSSVIRRLHYDDARCELTITFVSGKLYLYRMVPATVVQEFAAAPSRGEFFNHNIRNRYPYAEVTAPARTRGKLRRSPSPPRKAQRGVNSG